MNFLIIGGNATGMSAAAKLRKNMPNASITVLEKGDLVSFGACGLPYFIADEFSDPNEMIARPLEAFQKTNIDIKLFYEAIHLDAQSKKVKALNLKTNQEEVFGYDKLLISTGASPFMPPIEGINLKGVYTLTKFHDGTALKEALKLAQKVVIIGGGFIGLEAAEAMLHQDKDVTIIEMESRVSAKVFDSEMTEHLEKIIVSSGVKLQLEEQVQAIIGTDKVQAVKTDKGEYHADLVLIATGFVPNTQWCKDSGIQMLANGAININNSCQTNLPNIFSGGDCATVFHCVSQQNSYIPLATTANKLGRILGDILADIPNQFQGTLGSSALRFLNFQIGRTGLSEYEAKKLGYDYATNLINDFNHTGYVPNKVKLFVKLIYDKKTRILLGGQICGEKDAVLRVDVLATAIFNNMTVDKLGMLDLVYAPPFSRTWDILNIAGNTCK